MEQKEKNEQTETKEEKKTKTNLELKDTELDQVSGGNYGDTSFFRVCSRCGNTYLGICSCDPLNPFRDQGPFL